MQFFRIMATLVVTASAASESEKDAKVKQIIHAAQSFIASQNAAYVAKMKKQRRLQSVCWNDCSSDGQKTLGTGDNRTVCGFPDRCDSKVWEDSCVSDCGRSRMEALIACETKQYCVDMKRGEDGACPTTLGLLEGAATNPTDVGPCAECAEQSAELNPAFEMVGMGTMDMDISKLTMVMSSDKYCPKTLAAGECALSNADPCLDSTKSTDGSFMFFAALCECPCGQKMAKLLWDISAMQMSACKKGLKDKFETKAPSQMDFGPVLFSSGLLDCFACDWNKKACTASVNKWVTNEGLKALFTGLSQIPGECDEETTTTTTTTTTLEQPPAATTSFASRAGLFAAVASVLVAVTLA